MQDECQQQANTAACKSPKTVFADNAAAPFRKTRQAPALCRLTGFAIETGVMNLGSSGTLVYRGMRAFSGITCGVKIRLRRSGVPIH